MLGEPKQIGQNSFIEYPDGSMDIGGPNGWVTVQPFERRETGLLIGKEPLRLMCAKCGKSPATDDWLCTRCHNEVEESSAPKFQWHVIKNGERNVIHGTSTANTAYVRYNDYCKKQGFEWNWGEECFYDKNGNRYTLKFEGVYTVNKT